LFDKLKALDANQVTEKTKHYLTKDEVKAVMARRDKIVAQFQKLSSEKGEKEVSTESCGLLKHWRITLEPAKPWLAQSSTASTISAIPSRAHAIEAQDADSRMLNCSTDWLALFSRKVYCVMPKHRNLSSERLKFE